MSMLEFYRTLAHVTTSVFLSLYWVAVVVLIDSPIIDHTHTSIL